MTEDVEERMQDLEVKLAFQEKLIRELDALVRTFGDRLDKTERELKELRESVRSPEQGLGPINEKPPHY